MRACKFNAMGAPAKEVDCGQKLGQPWKAAIERCKAIGKVVCLKMNPLSKVEESALAPATLQTTMTRTKELLVLKKVSVKVVVF